MLQPLTTKKTLVCCLPAARIVKVVTCKVPEHKSAYIRVLSVGETLKRSRVYFNCGLGVATKSGLLHQNRLDGNATLGSRTKLLHFGGQRPLCLHKACLYIILWS